MRIFPIEFNEELANENISKILKEQKEKEEGWLRGVAWKYKK
jgi:hypothetical protein